MFVKRQISQNVFLPPMLKLLIIFLLSSFFFSKPSGLMNDVSCYGHHAAYYILFVLVYTCTLDCQKKKTFFLASFTIVM